VKQIGGQRFTVCAKVSLTAMLIGFTHSLAIATEVQTSVMRPSLGQRELRDSAAALMTQARQKCQERSYKAAEALCKKVQALGPLDSDGLTTLAWCTAGQGRFDEALTLLAKSKAIAESAEEKSYCFQISADIYENIAQFDNAINAYEAAKAATPLHPKARFWTQRIAVLHKLLAQNIHADNYANQTEPFYKGWGNRTELKMFIPSLRSNEPNTDYIEAIEAAMAAWSQATKLPTVVRVTDKTNADIVVLWVPSTSDSPETGCLYNPKGFIDKSFVCLTVIDPTSETYKARLTTMCLHEIGHALGIKNHSANPQDVMYDRSLLVPAATLSDRDQKTLVAITARL
jgi:tetratricopeptide (TPR) repeat protein